jgi:hypothetical protein
MILLFNSYAREEVYGENFTLDGTVDSPRNINPFLGIQEGRTRKYGEKKLVFLFVIDFKTLSVTQFLKA